MKMEVEQPQTKSFSQVIWFVLEKTTRCLYHYVLMILTLIYSTFALTTVSSEVKPPPENKEKTSPPPSFSSLPDEIVANCIAFVSKSYYPQLSLVCKTFRSLIFSRELTVARFQLRTRENILHVCLKLPDRSLPSWFSLWIKPDQTLTTDMEEESKIALVHIPSSYSPRVPMFKCKVGSKYYGMSQSNAKTTSRLRVKNMGIYRRRCKSPMMKVARKNATTGILDGKIYVMGGCKEDESANWGEVFDPKTQTWESLPDPGIELRSSLIKKIEVNHRKLYVRSNWEKDFVYDPKEGKWDVVAKKLCDKRCVTGNVEYRCGKQGCLWYDRKLKKWKKVEGLASLMNRNRHCDFVEIVNYNGKLLALWDMFADDSDSCQNKNIWCAVIALERRNNGDEVWGKVEWSSVVLRVPNSYVFLRGEVKRV